MRMLTWCALHGVARRAKAFAPVQGSMRRALLTTSTRHRVAFFGSGAVGARCLEILLDASAANAVREPRAPAADFDVVLAVTHPPTRGRRRAPPIPSPVATLAEQRGVPVETGSAADAGFLAEFRALAPDVAVTAAYGQMLVQEFLDVPRCATLNVHPSLLPRWRGAAPVQRALQVGDRVVGVSVLQTVRKMDAGCVLAQHAIQLTGDETAPELMQELFEVGSHLLLDHLGPILEGGASEVAKRGIAQSELVHAPLHQRALSGAIVHKDPAKPPLARKVRKSEGQVSFSGSSAVQVHNTVRAFQGWPGAWTEVVRNGVMQRLQLLQTRLVPAGAQAKDALDAARKVGPHGALGTLYGESLRVTCAGGTALDVLEVQPQGKAAMSARAFCNGVQGVDVRWSDGLTDRENVNPDSRR